MSEERTRAIAALAPWFHKLLFADGLQTAPDHPLGDSPGYEWKVLESLLPRDPSGWTALDVGCTSSGAAPSSSTWCCREADGGFPKGANGTALKGRAWRGLCT